MKSDCCFEFHAGAMMCCFSGKTHGLVRVEYRVRNSLHAEALVAGQRVCLFWLHNDALEHLYFIASPAEDFARCCLEKNTLRRHREGDASEGCARFRHVFVVCCVHMVGVVEVFNLGIRGSYQYTVDGWSRMDGWMESDGWMDGWMNGWMNGWMDR